MFLIQFKKKIFEKNKNDLLIKSIALAGNTLSWTFSIASLNIALWIAVLLSNFFPRIKRIVRWGKIARQSIRQKWIGSAIESCHWSFNIGGSTRVWTLVSLKARPCKEVGIAKFVRRMMLIKEKWIFYRGGICLRSRLYRIILMRSQSYWIRRCPIEDQLPSLQNSCNKNFTNVTLYFILLIFFSLVNNIY